MSVLITGAAGGIGSAIAAEFEADGHRVFRHDLRSAAGIHLTGDLLEPTVLADLATFVRENQVDVVVAAHGLAGAGDVESLSVATIQTVMRVNAISVVALFTALEDVLREREGTYIVVSSEAGLSGEARNAIYSASKFALIGWASERARGIAAPRLRVICPGMTDTPLLASGLRGMAEAQGHTYEQFLAQRLGAVPMGRLGRPAEIARSVIWLSELQTRRCVVAAVTGGSAFE
jgi:NAD(P)-dependent dehydrogenase (short-subunit alcohol dehydrogenase family)